MQGQPLYDAQTNKAQAEIETAKAQSKKAEAQEAYFNQKVTNDNLLHQEKLAREKAQTEKIKAELGQMSMHNRVLDGSGEAVKLAASNILTHMGKRSFDLLLDGHLTTAEILQELINRELFLEKRRDNIIATADKRLAALKTQEDKEKHNADLMRKLLEIEADIEENQRLYRKITSKRSPKK